MSHKTKRLQARFLAAPGSEAFSADKSGPLSAPDRVHLLPPPQPPFFARDGRGPFTYDPVEVKANYEASKRDGCINFRHWRESAAGWMAGLDFEDATGMHAPVRYWTPDGQEAIAKGSFRDMSAEVRLLWPDAEPSLGNPIRITSITGAALVTDPALPLQQFSQTDDLETDDEMDKTPKTTPATTDATMSVAPAPVAAPVAPAAAPAPAAPAVDFAAEVAVLRTSVEDFKAQVTSLQSQLATYQETELSAAVDRAVTTKFSPAGRDGLLTYAKAVGVAKFNEWVATFTDHPAATRLAQGNPETPKPLEAPADEAAASYATKVLGINVEQFNLGKTKTA
jgi:hypothetical protein